MKRATLVTAGLLALAACTDRDPPTATPAVRGKVADVSPTVTGPATQVAAGNGLSCAVRSDGSLECWGSSLLGQTAPTGTFIQVSLGSFFGCAIRTDGTLACWGDNTYGQATPPSGTFTRVSAGATHACAIRTDNTAACWGDDSQDATEAFPGTYAWIAAGMDYSCGVKSDGSPANTLVCWGDGSPGVPSPTPTALRVGRGASAFCWIGTDTELHCRGNDDRGQASPPSGTYTDVDGSQLFGCAVATSGTLNCWGDTDDGKTTPPNGQFVQVSTGLDHACALRTDGRVDCWGRTSGGAATPPLDIAARVFTTTTLGSTPEPSAVGETVTFTATVTMTDFGQPVTSGTVTFIEAGTCSAPTTTLAANVAVNASGQASFTTTGLAVGTHTITACYNGATIFQPSKGRTVHEQSPAGAVVQVSAGESAACAIRSDRTLLCWGVSVGGPLPTGTFRRVSVGESFGCAIRTDRTLACWGDNSFGRATPPTGMFTKVSAGHTHACAIRTNGELVCWGDDTDDRSEWTLGTYLQVAAGTTWGCAIRSDDAPMCWGATPGTLTGSLNSKVLRVGRGGVTGCWINSSQDLVCTGSDVEGSKFPPSGDFVDVDGGNTFACAIGTDGKLPCWGEMNNERLPTQPRSGLYASLSAFDDQVCALTTTGRVSCFGDPNEVDLLPLEIAANVPTTTTLGSSPTPSTFGQSVTFTATVKMTEGGAAVTSGTVTFIETGTCTAPVLVRASNVALDAAGHASFSTAALAAGQRGITACYNGTLTFATSSGSTTQKINPAATTTTLSAPSAQYSDGVTLTATITPAQLAGSSPTGTVQFNVNFVDIGSPVALGADGKATLSNAALGLAPGTYTAIATFTSTSGNFSSSSNQTTLTIAKEDASIVYAEANAVATQVSVAGGSLNAGGVSLAIGIKEKEPDAASPASAAGIGNIANAGLSVTLAPVGPGSSFALTCSGGAVSGTGYAATRNFTCTTTAALPVNVYDVQATVTGSYYTGSYDDVLVVYDPSLGFVTGGGTFTINGDRVHFAVDLKYKKNGADPKGSVMVVRRNADGTTSSLSSNALSGLALGDDPSVPMGWAAVTGKSSYTAWNAAKQAYVTVGNQAFTLYLEDRGNPGNGTDRVWVGGPGNLAMTGTAATAQTNAASLTGGNVIVPHRGP